MRIDRLAWALGFGLTLAACGGDRHAGAEPAGDAMLIFAASDLQAAFVEVLDRYEAESGYRPEAVFGSTGNLATQIEHGAPADLFFAANEVFLERLEGARRIEPESRRVYAYGRLALIWSTAAPVPAELGDLERVEYRTIAIANPEHAPYGVAAREALQALGLWSGVRARLVTGENIAQAYQFVSTGNADAGVVALGLVLGPVPRPHLVIPDTLHAPLRQAAAVVRDSRKTEEARHFLEYVLGADGQEILARYGFEPPDR